MKTFDGLAVAANGVLPSVVVTDDYVPLNVNYVFCLWCAKSDELAKLAKRERR